VPGIQAANLEGVQFHLQGPEVGCVFLKEIGDLIVEVREGEFVAEGSLEEEQGVHEGLEEELGVQEGLEEELGVQRPWKRS